MLVLKSLFSAFITIGIVALSPTAQASNLSSAPIKPLNSIARATGASNIEQLSQSAKIAIIYQPDCQWCEKQAEELQGLSTQCPGVYPLLLGTNARPRALRRAADRLATEFAAFEASPQLLRQLQGVSTTPVTLFLDKDNQLIAKQRAYIPLEKMQEALTIISGGSCQF